MNACSSKYTYLDTPDFLKASLHTVTATSTPVYILGIYCILFKTPKQMASVKWHLFILHFWIILFDCLTGVFIIPQLIPPAPAGVSHGLFRSMGVSAAIQTMLTFLIVSYIFVATVAIYENRFFILCQFRAKTLWTLGRRLWLLFHYTESFALLIPVYLLIPEQDQAIREVLQKLPCLPGFIINDELFVVAQNYFFHFTAAILAITDIFLETGWFITQLIRNGKKQTLSKMISKKLYRMHQQFILAMIVQMTVPLICMGFPVCYIIIATLISYYNQAATNICVIIATTHGLVSTVVMIIVHKPYRLAVIRMIRREKLEKFKISNLSGNLFKDKVLATARS